MRIAATRVVTAAAVASLLWLGRAGELVEAPVILTESPATAASPASHIFSFRTESDRALMEWGLSRFEAAGLELPALDIAFHDDKQPCHGFFGLYRGASPPEVDICGFNWDRFLPMPKKVVLHELAHAWSAEHLTEADRSAFLQMRGLMSWGDDQLPWAEQGSEQAAEIIAWALMDGPVSLSMTQGTDDVSMAAAYELLTEGAPLIRSDQDLTPGR
jgi:hypothetical protein